MSDSSPILDQCIALAGIAQSIRCVQNLAWKGQANDTDLRAVVASLLKVNAESAVAIYDGSFELSSGLRLLNRQLDPKDSDKDPEFVNLAINVIALQSQLNKNADLLASLGTKIDNLAREFQGFDEQNDPEEFERLLERCSQVYQQTLSTMPLRIQVKGDPNHLKDPAIQNRVRAALLAAVRATFLWRQSGGSRWHFIFRKKQILNGLKQLISHPIRN